MAQNRDIRSELEQLEDKTGFCYSGKSTASIDAASNMMLWLKHHKEYIPIEDLIERGVIASEHYDFDLFKFFSRNSSSGNLLFRKTTKEDDKKACQQEALAATWVALVLRSANNLDLPEHIPGTLSDNILTQVARMSRDPKRITDVFEFLKKIGIGLVVSTYIKGSKVDGMAAKNCRGNPIVGISLRYDRLDNFWFTLLHEMAHIAHHFEELDTALIDDLKNPAENEIEREANHYAKEAIVPRSTWSRSKVVKTQSEASIRELAEQLQIHPALIAGRLQFETNNFSLHRKLVDGFSVKAALDGIISR